MKQDSRMQLEDAYEQIGDDLDKLAQSYILTLNPAQFCAIVTQHIAKILRICADQSNKSESEARQVLIEAIENGLSMGEEIVKHLTEKDRGRE